MARAMHKPTQYSLEGIQPVDYRTSRVVYIRQLATLVSYYPPVLGHSAFGSSSSPVYDLSQGFAPRPLLETASKTVQQAAGQLTRLHQCALPEHRAAPLGLGKGGAPWPSAR
jgi:hypothetical protein